MVHFSPLDTHAVRALQTGGPDANGQIPERHISDGSGVPCRHCLQQVENGASYLILSFRPFPAPQPYAEQGPIFLHAEPCAPWRGNGTIPPMLASPRYILRGYDATDRIVYGTGHIVETESIPTEAGRMLEDPAIAYVHVRSASNNCYQCRIDRG